MEDGTAPPTSENPEENGVDLVGLAEKNGYKKDGRGTWATDGETAIRHSVDQLPDGILDHTVTTDIETREKTVQAEFYPYQDGSPVIPAPETPEPVVTTPEPFEPMGVPEPPAGPG